MRYIFTHRTNGSLFQLFLPEEVSLDIYREWVEDENNVFAFSTNDGMMTSVDQSKMFLEYDISTVEQHIILPRSNELVTFFLKVMSEVSNATSTKYIPLGESKITVIKKDDDEILGFDGDYKAIPFKYIDFFKDSIGPEIVFSKVDSQLLKKSVDAAYYVLSEKGEIPELIQKYYDIYFRTK